MAYEREVALVRKYGLDPQTSRAGRGVEEDSEVRDSDVQNNSGNESGNEMNEALIPVPQGTTYVARSGEGGASKGAQWTIAAGILALLGIVLVTKGRTLGGILDGGNVAGVDGGDVIAGLASRNYTDKQLSVFKDTYYADKVAAAYKAGADDCEDRRMKHLLDSITATKVRLDMICPAAAPATTTAAA